MERPNVYLMSLAGLMFASAVSLAALNEAHLDVYVSLFTLAYFATATIFSQRRMSRDILGAVLFSLFSLILAIKVLEILVR